MTIVKVLLFVIGLAALVAVFTKVVPMMPALGGLARVLVHPVVLVVVIGGLLMWRATRSHAPRLDEAKLVAAHHASANHRDQLLASESCGCFHCLAIYPPSQIREWADPPSSSDPRLGRTALCARCGIDAVIGSAAGYPITRAFLEAMRARWFGS